MIDTRTTVPRRLWSKEVKRLAGNRCICCGSVGGDTIKTRLESHHVFMREECPDLENVLENGVCLCHACHYAAHNGDYTKFGQRRAVGVGSSRYPDKDTAAIRQAIIEHVQNTAIFQAPKEYLTGVKAHAEERGESVNGFIKRAIDETMERDQAKEGRG